MNEEKGFFQVWERVLSRLREEMNGPTFAMWFGHCHFVDNFERQVVLSVPSAFVRNWIELKYLLRLKDHLALEAGGEAAAWTVHFQIASGSDSIVPLSRGAARIDPPAAPVQDAGEAGATHPPAAGEPTTASSPAGPGDPAYLARCRQLNINPEYCFENLVRGGGNQLAAEVCEAVARGEIGKALDYNPLFLHGDVGLGKTHLLHSIANSFLLRNRHCNICLLRTEQFFNAYTRALNDRKYDEFRSRFRREVDLLLIDDIQFLQQKKGFEEELFNTYNEVFDRNVQIVIAADRSPAQLRDIQDRLVSRFRSGQVVGLLPPDFTHRLSIVRRFADQRGLLIAEDDMAFIAGVRLTNIRDLLSAMKNVAAQARMDGRAIDRELISRVIDTPRHRVDAVRIQKIVARYFGIDLEELKSSRRKKALTRPRHIAMYLCRELTGESLVDIGRRFGGKDHSSVIYSVDKVAGELLEDPHTRELVDQIKRQISGDPDALA